jgi:hypothetical protein
MVTLSEAKGLAQHDKHFRLGHYLIGILKPLTASVKTITFSIYSSYSTKLKGERACRHRLVVRRSHSIPASLPAKRNRFPSYSATKPVPGGVP